MKTILVILFLIHFGHNFAQSGFYYSHIKPYSNEPRSLVEFKEGFLIAGENSLSGGHSNGFLMLIDRQGHVVWEKIIPSLLPDKYESYSSAVFHQGAFYVGGFRWMNNKRRNLIVKIDLNGNTIWDRIFGGEQVFGGDNDVQDLKLNEDGILVALSGYSALNTSTDAQLIQLDLEANILWSKYFSAYDLSTQYYDFMERISPMTDGYLLNMTSVYVPAWQYEHYIIKTDKQGNEIWRKNLSNYQSNSTGNDTLLYYFSATSYKDNNIISLHIKEDMTNSAAPHTKFLIEFDKNGNEIDYRKLPPTNGFPKAEIFTSEENEIFILAQQELGAPLYTQLYAIKFNAQKNVEWEHNYGVENITEFYFCGINASDGGVLLGGRNQHFQMGAPYFNSIIVKTDCRGELEWSYETCISPELEEITIFPNPFSNYVNIHIPNLPNDGKEVIIYMHDLTGKVISQSLFYDTNVIQLTTSDYATGLYYCTIYLGDTILSKYKIIKL